MLELDPIPPCSFYGKRTCILPPLPHISDDSDSSDDDENITLKQLQSKLMHSENVILGKHLFYYINTCTMKGN